MTKHGLIGVGAFACVTICLVGLWYFLGGREAFSDGEEDSVIFDASKSDGDSLALGDKPKSRNCLGEHERINGWEVKHGSTTSTVMIVRENVKDPTQTVQEIIFEIPRPLDGTLAVRRCSVVFIHEENVSENGKPQPGYRQVLLRYTYSGELVELLEFAIDIEESRSRVPMVRRNYEPTFSLNPLYSLFALVQHGVKSDSSTLIVRELDSGENIFMQHSALLGGGIWETEGWSDDAVHFWASLEAPARQTKRFYRWDSGTFSLDAFEVPHLNVQRSAFNPSTGLLAYMLEEYADNKSFEGTSLRIRDVLTGTEFVVHVAQQTAWEWGALWETNKVLAYIDEQGEAKSFEYDYESAIVELLTEAQQLVTCPSALRAGTNFRWNDITYKHSIPYVPVVVANAYTLSWDACDEGSADYFLGQTFLASKGFRSDISQATDGPGGGQSGFRRGGLLCISDYRIQREYDEQDVPEIAGTSHEIICGFDTEEHYQNLSRASEL